MAVKPAATLATASAGTAHRGVLILDFGSQYTHLIARRVREAGVYAGIVPGDATPEQVGAAGPRALILSGGPGSATPGCELPLAAGVFDLGLPILGICYGMQAMAAHFGADVARGGRREFGPAVVRARGHSRLLRDLQDEVNEHGHGLLKVWMSHGDHVTEPPPGFITIASSAQAPVAGIADEARGCYGLQFHPEVTHTPQGMAILRRFLFDVAGCEADWQTQRIVTEGIERLRRELDGDEVLLALSGGVDSAVTAMMLHRAIGRRLHCIFVDTGLLRAGEATEVMQVFAERLGLNLRRVDAAARFFRALAGVTDPEEKRRRIGHTFIEVFEQESARLPAVRWLAQGTIYPDVIESAAASPGRAEVIKSHHNVGGLPERMKLKLVEPLRELFKDEVREAGVQLGLPRALLLRHPFPGPGLGVRVLGEVRPAYVELLRRADAIYLEELHRHGLYAGLAQAFAVFLPVRAVGVKGDRRSYQHVIALRAVETTDFMTARWARLPAEVLQTVATRIINEIDGIARVVYDVSDKPPATIEWE